MSNPTQLAEKQSRYFYREVFYAAFGFGPFECYFCHESVQFGSASGTKRPEAIVIHHLDCNQQNNHPFNLVPSHSRCHSIWHGRRRGFWPREEKPYVVSPETRAKLSAAHKGRKFTAEHRRKLSEAGKRRWEREKAQEGAGPVV